MNPESSAFCGRCGNSLSTGNSARESDIELTRAERRRLSIMFCDLVGSTELSGQMDPEELHHLTGEYQRVCTDVISYHGGRVAQFQGDGILAYFGYPAAHDDDAQRAVRAGLDIISAVARLRATLTPSMRVRVAVHTGLVVVGRSGGGLHSNSVEIVGEAPNVAARMQAIAQPGSVVVSAPTYRLIEGFFICRNLGATTLRGVALPVVLYEVVEASELRTAFDRAIATGLTPFISREQEVARLIERWDQARNQTGQVVLLCGEAGIGKSRLVQILRERAATDAVMELECRCSSYFVNSALHPIIDLLERALQFQRDDDSHKKVIKLERALEQSGFNLLETVPVFCSLLSLPQSDRYPSVAMTPRRQKQKTLEYLIAWLLSLAKRHPTRLIIEDLHWADPSTLELISSLIERVAEAHLLAVFIFRPDFVPPWPTRPNGTTINLGRLSRTASELMVAQITGAKQLPVEVIRSIVEKTEGVPLFIEELTRMILESGLLREQDDRYMLAGPLPPLAIPSTLYDSLMARLDRLGTAKGVAQLGATIGKEFSYELLHAISSLDEARLTGALNRLVAAEMLDQQLSTPHVSYSFRHALIRDAAYESLLRSTRREYHRRVAEALQERFAATIETQPELLANHFTEAGLSEWAIPYWQRAGQRALERSANQEAIRHLTKGLELLSGLAETPERLQQGVLMQTTLGTSLIAIKGFSSDEVEAVYARARALSERIGDTSQLFRVLWGLWLSYAARGEYRAALEIGEQCMRLAQVTGDVGLLLEAHHALGVGFVCIGNHIQGLEHLERTIGMYDPSRHRIHSQIFGHDPAAVCLMHASWALWLLGYPDQALATGNKSVASARELSHPSTLATVAAFVACLQQMCGNVQAVEDLSKEAMSISAEHEFVYPRTMATILAGWASVQQGQVTEGIAQMRLGFDAFRAIGGVLLSSYFSGLLAQAYAADGRTDEPLKVLAAMDDDLEPWWKAESHRLRGELILKQSRQGNEQSERREEALEYFNQALAIARAQKAKSLELRAAMSLCRLSPRESKDAVAWGALEEVFSWFTEGYGTQDLQEAKALLK